MCTEFEQLAIARERDQEMTVVLKANDSMAEVDIDGDSVWDIMLWTTEYDAFKDPSANDTFGHLYETNTDLLENLEDGYQLYGDVQGVDNVVDQAREAALQAVGYYTEHNPTR